MPSKPRQRWRTMLVEDARLRWVRTQLLGRAPGFSPGPPVVGPYPPGHVWSPDRAVRRGPDVRWLEGTTGVVEVDGGARRARVPRRRALVAAHARHTARSTTSPSTARSVGRVGFRTIENRSADGSLDLWVNGVRVFCRGAVWTPGDLGSARRGGRAGAEPGPGARHRGVRVRRLPRPLRRARAAGLAGPDVRDLRLPARRPGLRRDRRRPRWPTSAPGCSAHPSTVVVCGSAEHEQQAAMFGVSPSTGYAGELAALLKPVVEASGLDAVWVDSSPSGGDPVIRVDTGIAQYFGVGAYLRDLPDARHSRVKFAVRVPGLQQPHRPGGRRRSAAGPRRRLGLRRRARALPAAAVRRRRDRGRRPARHRRGDGRRVRRVAPAGLRVRRRHRALAARRRTRRGLGAARPRGPAEAGRPRPRADPAADRGVARRRGAQRPRRARRARPVVRRPRRTLVVELLREDGSAAESAEEALGARSRTATACCRSRRCSAGSPT